MRKSSLTLVLLLTNLFIAFLGIGLVIPIMPTLMNELNISGTVVGNMVAVFAVAQLVVSPISGKLIDTVGRKVMIVIGLFIFSASELLFAVGQGLPELFTSRILGGVSAAFIMPAVTAFIADITTNETRSKALGYMSAAISTGYIIGPGIGGFLAEFGTRMPFFFAAALALFAAIFSMIMLKEPEREVVDVNIKKPGFKRIFDPMYFIVFIIIFVLSFGLSSFEGVFSLFVDHKFGFTPMDIAIIITGSGLVGALAQILLFDRLTKLIGEKKIIFISLVFSAVMVALMTVANSYWSILFVAIIVFVGFDLIRPAATSYLSKVAGNEQGFVGGMNSMFTSLGTAFGPMVGGYLFDINLDYPYYFATIILAIASIMTYVWMKSGPRHVRANFVTLNKNK